MPEIRSSARLSLFGWLIYDFANTIFSMNILTMYFAQWVIVDLGYPDIYYSMAYSTSMIVVALTLPLLGHLSDERGNKKSFLVGFSLACIIATAALGTTTFASDDVATLALIGLICVAIANYFFEGALVFYNALLPSVSQKSNIGKVSGSGVALGYVGSITGLLLVQPIVEGSVPFLGSGRDAAFLPTAVLFFIFFLPTWLFLRERSDVPNGSAPPQLVGSIGRLVKSLKEARRHRGAFRFLIADYFFEDAIATLVIFMAVYAQKVMGMPDSEKVALFIISTGSAIAGSFASGWLSDRFGPYRTLKYIVIGWIVTLVTAAFTTNMTAFWVLGSCVGVFLGGTWSVSRPLLNGLVPNEKLGVFYGLYSLSGRVAAVIGPMVWGLVVLFFNSERAAGRFILTVMDGIGLKPSVDVTGTIEYRFAIISLALIMLAGLYIYRRVPDAKAERLDHDD